MVYVLSSLWSHIVGMQNDLESKTIIYTNGRTRQIGANHMNEYMNIEYNEYIQLNIVCKQANVVASEDRIRIEIGKTPNIFGATEKYWSPLSRQTLSRSKTTTEIASFSKYVQCLERCWMAIKPSVIHHLASAVINASYILYTCQYVAQQREKCASMLLFVMIYWNGNFNNGGIASSRIQEVHCGMNSHYVHLTWSGTSNRRRTRKDNTISGVGNSMNKSICEHISIQQHARRAWYWWARVSGHAFIVFAEIRISFGPARTRRKQTLWNRAHLWRLRRNFCRQMHSSFPPTWAICFYFSLLSVYQCLQLLYGQLYIVNTNQLFANVRQVH